MGWGRWCRWGRGWGSGGGGAWGGDGEGVGEGVGGGLDMVKIYNLKVRLMTYHPKGQSHPAGCSSPGPKLRECEGRLIADCSILKITNDCILRFFDI